MVRREAWVVALIVAFTRAGHAEPTPPHPVSFNRAGTPGRASNRVTHFDQRALSGGALLFGVSYAIAVSGAVDHRFAHGSAQLAVPLLGPWLYRSTWPCALDSLAQLGGTALVLQSFANPIVALGPASAQPMRPRLEVGLGSLGLGVEF